ncbi:hypothetical protein GCM10011297_06030 [Bacterioplanes sanyensis]|nr:hypothetical protein GCM10011297_06030 [Bacterioplanes sanyensis]
MAFGLAGARITGWLLALGVAPAAAYALMVCLGLLLAAIGAVYLARRAGLSPMLACVLALLWLISPMALYHHDYSMLALGIVLLSAYFAVFSAWLQNPTRWLTLAWWSTLLVAVFVDGYTFVMLALGSSGLLLLSGWSKHQTTWLGWRRWAAHLAGLVLAYVAYTQFIGTSAYHPSPLSFFRGWGVDVTFWLQPEQGQHWLADWLGWSTHRSMQDYYGDHSVWRTTFMLPMFVALALLLWWRRKVSRPVAVLLLMALVAAYLALGPALKMNATKPEALRHIPNMPAEQVSLATGSGWLYEHVPGLSSMRASYRWTALMSFALWWALVMLIGQRQGRLSAWQGWLATSLPLLLFMPPLAEQVHDGERYYDHFQRMTTEFIEPLQQDTAAGELVAFLPWGNDFMINYVAPAAGVNAFNIGGDKNMQQASKHWPDWFRQLGRGRVQSDYALPVATALQQGEVDAVVIPKVDMLWAPHNWPSERIGPFDRATIEQLRQLPERQVLERQRYWLVR